MWQGKRLEEERPCLESCGSRSTCMVKGGHLMRSVPLRGFKDEHFGCLIMDLPQREVLCKKTFQAF